MHKKLALLLSLLIGAPSVCGVEDIEWEIWKHILMTGGLVIIAYDFGYMRGQEAEKHKSNIQEKENQKPNLLDNQYKKNSTQEEAKKLYA